LRDLAYPEEFRKTNRPTNRHPSNGLFLQYNPGKLATERLNHSGFHEARNDGVTVASAGRHANHLHLPSDNHARPHHTIFYRPDALPDDQPTV